MFQGTVLGFNSEYFFVFPMVFVLREDILYTLMFLLFVYVYVYIHTYASTVLVLWARAVRCYL
ncbi:hypothetical protein V1520DRAFT_371550 [Lipomyces starkeyi]|uniref:Uncharacterized protein n=1 Tax=Lipomyces starkeyi NRRL Y-11557 TaxID=675824 RepID=A0A1E3Q6X9_LIPST|nr:hypothetical protein LIPSTDRAFT_290743 [Lipomyces starkeyi NRRL Y-11557]